MIRFDYEVPDYSPSAPVTDRVGRVNMLVMDHLTRSCKRDGIKSAVAYVNGRSIGGVVFEEN